jgi:hypothetical protein
LPLLLPILLKVYFKAADNKQVKYVKVIETCNFAALPYILVDQNDEVVVITMRSMINFKPFLSKYGNFQLNEPFSSSHLL